MNKTIIGVYGRQNEGKSATLNNLIDIFATTHPAAIINYIIPTGDRLVTIDINGHRIGIETQGDPGSRMITQRTIEQLITIHHCEIIACATRTSGDTVREVDRVAAVHNFHTIWKSTYYTPDLNISAANQIAAEEIAALIFHYFSGRI
jgi:hypothetical protein